MTRAKTETPPGTPEHPDRPLPLEAEVRTHDLQAPDPADEKDTDVEERPGEGENAPGFLKPARQDRQA